MLLHPHQKKVVRDPARFKVIRAGRKSGKTTVEIEIMLFKAVAREVDLALTKARTGNNRNVLFIAPTQVQARKIVWEALKTRVGKLGQASEQRLEMRVKTADGGYSTIYVGGWENRENYRGMTDVVHITFDETDSMRDFFIGWQEIFRPMLLDTGGTADFIGTPKKENPNLRRLEKEFADKGENFAKFHFETSDNPHIEPKEIESARRDMDATTYRQEIKAEYVENEGALFKYSALVDLFSNTITKTKEKYLIVDIADDGSDKTIFTFFQGAEAYRFDMYESLQTDGIISQIRESAAQHKIPYSHIAVDAIGVGAGVASSPLLRGIIGFKGSYSPLRTTIDPTKLPNVHYRKEAPLTSEYKNLRSQCVFTLAKLVNDHEFAISIDDVRIKSMIIEELSTYQDASKGDGKLMATQKADVREIIGRSPDLSDTLIMRMYFVLRDSIAPDQSEEEIRVNEAFQSRVMHTRKNQASNSSK